MTSEVMEAVLAPFNRKLVFETEKSFFSRQCYVYPESMIGHFSQIQMIFLPKNTTLRLQPLDTDIIKHFKVKYRKRLVKYVLTRIQEDASATQIVKGADVLDWIGMLYLVFAKS